MSSTSRILAKAEVPLKVGPKQVFKHILLNELLKGMNRRYGNGWTYVDFTPGPGAYRTVDGGLGALYSHARRMHKNKELNYFTSYISALQRFNGETDGLKLKQIPDVEDMPSIYPSNAGLAAMYMDDKAKAVLVEEDLKVAALLKDALEDRIQKRQFQVHSGEAASYYAIGKALLPPTNRRGLVTFDLDHKLGGVTPKGRAKGLYATQSYFLKDSSQFLGMICKRWPTGTFFFPYPLTSAKPPISLIQDVVRSGVKRVLNVSMFFEGKPDTPHSADYGGSGIGAIIVNPPDDLDLSLHEHLPKLKMEVFQPEITLADDERVSPVLCSYVTKKTQPWDHIYSDPKLPTWSYSPEIKWTKEELEQKAIWEKQDNAEHYEHWLNTPDDDDFSSIFEKAKFVPEPAPLDPEHAKDWKIAVKQQALVQDPARATMIKVRKK